MTTGTGTGTASGAVIPGRPTPGEEYLPYYGQYIELAPDGDLVAAMAQQVEDTLALLRDYPEDAARWRPAPGEWNAIEIVGHLADSERIFSYRALRVARADTTPIEGVDDVPAYVTAGQFDKRSLQDVAAEFAAVRQASLALFRSLDADAWMRRGTADGNRISVRALAYIIAGHELHHLPDLRKQREMGAA